MTKDKKKPVVSSKELAAMGNIVKGLEGLTEEECKQVLGWACKRILGEEFEAVKQEFQQVIPCWQFYPPCPYDWWCTPIFTQTQTSGYMQIEGTTSNNADNVTLTTTN